MAGLKIRDANGKEHDVLCISGINTMDKRIRLYEPECSISAGVVSAPLPEGYDAQTFLEKLAFLELEVNSTSGVSIFAANTRTKSGTKVMCLYMNSSGGIGCDFGVSVSDTSIQWAVDPSDLYNTGIPTMRIGLL